jgi:hypothetical protein
MDDQRFDAIAKLMGTGSRRGFLKGMLGLGAVAFGSAVRIDDAEAARRGYSGPPISQTPPQTLGISFERSASGCRPIFTLTGFDPNSDYFVYWYFFTPTGGAGGPYGVAVQTNASGVGSATVAMDLGRGFTVTASLEASPIQAGPIVVAC